MERIGRLYAGKLGRRGTEDIAATCYPETTAIRLGSVGHKTIFMLKYQPVTWLLMHHPPVRARRLRERRSRGVAMVAAVEGRREGGDRAY